MARPLKAGVDYFPLDVNLDVKIDLIESQYGNDGFAVIIKLWKEIYGENGYYYKWGNKIAMLFAYKKANNIDIKTLEKIIDLALEVELFDKPIFEKYGVLTSAGIQKRYLEITERRKRVDLEEKYLLIEIPQKSVNVYINGINVYKNSKNADNNPQSKGKERKVKERKVNSKDCAPAAKKPARKYGDFTDILSEIENENLLKAYLDFIEMRKKVKKPMTERALELLIQKVKSLEPVSVDNQIRMLEESIEHGWQSVYPLKDSGTAQVKKSKFANYEDTNKMDYAALEDKLLDMMMEVSNES